MRRKVRKDLPPTMAVVGPTPVEVIMVLVAEPGPVIMVVPFWAMLVVVELPGSEGAVGLVTSGAVPETAVPETAVPDGEVPEPVREAPTEVVELKKAWRGKLEAEARPARAARKSEDECIMSVGEYYYSTTRRWKG